MSASGSELFEGLPEQARPGEARAPGPVRMRWPDRAQVSWEMLALDDLLARDHRARTVWAFAAGCDLSRLEDAIKARAGGPGAPAAAPHLLLALWLYATLDGVGSARRLDRLCTSDVAYRWLCGGVSMNYHTLADFRVAHPDLLDDLLCDSVLSLIDANLVSLEELAQDGMRVRAAAGASSFRRRDGLAERRAQVRAQVAQLRAELEADPGAGERRIRAARERAAREREARVEHALAELAKLQAAPEAAAPTADTDAAAPSAEAECAPEGTPPVGPDTAAPGDDSQPAADASAVAPARGGRRSNGKPRRAPRASTTDPEARIMKMADGGFRPAYNAQVISDPKAQVVVAVAPSQAGSDRGLARFAIEQIRDRYGYWPKRWLMDGGYTHHGDVEWAHGPGATPAIEVVCPLTRSKHGTDPTAPRRRDGPGMTSLRKRMAGAGREVYKRRGPAECIHGQFEQRGLHRFLVRGAAKVRAVLLWHALAHNLMRAEALKPPTEASA